ncbi:MAG: flagellin [Campylobacterota bacterium]|nr:flagellin [Campylobacterota bacterium]
MQLGRLEVMDQAQVDYVSKISKIQETDQKAQIDPDEKYKNASAKLTISDNEVMLDNVKFGYNSDTNDFFVRITKGDAEYQYPTEDMIKLKQSLMEAYRSSQS